jgi:hypothetical protein
MPSPSCWVLQGVQALCRVCVCVCMCVCMCVYVCVRVCVSVDVLRIREIRLRLRVLTVPLHCGRRGRVLRCSTPSGRNWRSESAPCPSKTPPVYNVGTVRQPGTVCVCVCVPRKALVCHRVCVHVRVVWFKFHVVVGCKTPARAGLLARIVDRGDHAPRDTCAHAAGCVRISSVHHQPERLAWCVPPSPLRRG